MKFVFPLILIVLLVGGCTSHQKDASDYGKDIAALEEIFPLLEADKVAAFRYQDWCKVLSYTRGSFANTTQSTCTYLAPTTPKAFDTTAENDLRHIWENVKSTGSGVYVISDIRFDASGKLVYAEFDCSRDFVRQRYVFDPGYTLPADWPNERWHTRINADWYYIHEDWN